MAFEIQERCQSTRWEFQNKTTDFPFLRQKWLNMKMSSMPWMFYILTFSPYLIRLLLSLIMPIFNRKKLNFVAAEHLGIIKEYEITEYHLGNVFTDTTTYFLRSNLTKFENMIAILSPYSFLNPPVASQAPWKICVFSHQQNMQTCYITI